MGKPVALTIAGSDPSGGAGIQADLKTFHQFGVYGEAVLTLLTVQNTCRVDRIEVLSPELILDQVRAVIEDIPPAAAKIGALGASETIEAIAGEAANWKFPLVVDPVMVSKHGAPLLPAAASSAFVRLLLPRAFLLTPNLAEASMLADMTIFNVEDMKTAARKLADLGAHAILVKGGHLDDQAIDILYVDGRDYEFAAARIETRHTHGTGCAYSAAITAELAKGASLMESISRAKEFITQAIRTNPGLGRGYGPINHHA